MKIATTLGMGGHYTFQLHNTDGTLVKEWDIDNLVPTAGLNHFLETEYGGGTQVATWYMGLIDNTSFSAIAAGDTAGSHAGWVESTNYDEAARQTVTFDAASGGVIATSAPCVYTMTTTGTIKGAFITSSNTKGGSAGVVVSEGTFLSLIHI